MEIMKNTILALALFMTSICPSVSSAVDLPQIEMSECANMKNPIAAYKYLQANKEQFDIMNKATIGSLNANTVFKYYSGNTSPMSNLPLIFTHGGSQKKVTVVGCGTYKEFPLSQLELALEEYKKLLVLNGYVEK